MALEHWRLAWGVGGCLPHCAIVAEQSLPLPSAGQLGGTLTQNSVFSCQWLTVAIGVVENFSASAVFLLLRVGWGTNSWWEGSWGPRELVRLKVAPLQTDPKVWLLWACPFFCHLRGHEVSWPLVDPPLTLLPSSPLCPFSQSSSAWC